MFKNKGKAAGKPLFEGDFQENIDDFVGKCKDRNLSALLKMSMYTDVSFDYNEYRLYIDVGLKGIEGKDENAVVLDYSHENMLVANSKYEVDIMMETARTYDAAKKCSEKIRGILEKAGISVIDKGSFCNKTFSNMHRMEKAIAKMEGG